MRERNKLIDWAAKITRERIYRLMNIITLAVSAVFFLKNVLLGEGFAMMVIGCVLFFYIAVLLLMRKIKLAEDTKYAIVSAAIMVVISIISIFSGDSFSDDFILYLSAMGLAGLFLRPQIPQLQLGLADGLFVIQCLAAPQKIGDKSQFIMCLALFNLAGILFSLVVARGRSFILESSTRAKEMETIVEQLAAMNTELNRSFELTHGRILDITNTNQMMEARTDELMTDSNNIRMGVEDTVSTCDNASKYIFTCKEQIRALVDNIRHFEEVLQANESRISSMYTEIVGMKDSVSATNEVFDGIQKEMQEIVDVVAQLKSIASSTNMLSLNASIEAARAGTMGAGFAVVAEKVQQLAVDSNKSSGHVEQIVKSMEFQVEKTREQMAESMQNVDASLASIAVLEEGFHELLTNFNVIYQNTEEQDASIGELAGSFDMIQESVSVMADYSEKNQTSIHKIVDAMKVYGSNMEQMEQDTQNLKQLVATMEEELSNHEK